MNIALLYEEQGKYEDERLLALALRLVHDDKVVVGVGHARNAHEIARDQDPGLLWRQPPTRGTEPRVPRKGSFQEM